MWEFGWIIKTPVGHPPKAGVFYLIMRAEVITIEAARQKLGKRGERLTDKQINDILSMLRFICNKAIDGVIEGKADYAN